MELVDAVQDVIGQVLQHGGLAQPQYGPVLWARQFTGQQEKFVPQLRKHQVLPCFGEAESLEGGPEVISQTNGTLPYLTGLPSFPDPQTLRRFLLQAPPEFWPAAGK